MKLMTAKELSKYLKLNEITIYKYLQEGKLPGFKIGSQWRFDRDEIDDFLRSSRRNPSPQADSMGNDTLQDATPSKAKRTKERVREHG
jgi:excisionase family DNA binding protein